MKPNYSLIEEKWIPIITNESKREELGLLDVIVRANELREIYDPSPLVTTSLHRLILAILHRVYGPYSEDEWINMYDKGKFDPKPLTEYFKKWKDRFWLFHDKFPFYQYPGLDAECKMNPKPIGSMSLEIASKESKTLFNHTFDEDAIELRPGEAAKGVIAIQNYVTGLGRSTPFPLKNPPIINKVIAQLKGRNLWETLILNLLPLEDEITGIYGTGTDNDIPIWEVNESDYLFKPEENYQPKGYVSYLTSISRRILLVPINGPNSLSVSKVYIRQGHKVAIREISNIKYDLFEDPFTPYIIRENGRKPLSVEKDRKIWRDCITWIEFSDTNSPPRVIHWIREILSILGDGFEASALISITGVLKGVSGDAKIDDWISETLPLPLAYLKNESLVKSLKEHLKLAEDVSLTLKSVSNELVKYLFLDEETRADKEKTKKRLRKLEDKIDKLEMRTYYWSSLEPHFYKTMNDIAEAKDEEEIEMLQREWAIHLYRSAIGAFNDATVSMDRTGKTLRASTVARSKLIKDLLYNQKRGKYNYRAPLSDFTKYIKEELNV